MTNLVNIIQFHADYVARSGYVVNIDTALDTVSIENHSDPEMNIFLDHESAQEYINDVEKFSELFPEIVHDTLALAVAKPWIDNCS